MTVLHGVDVTADLERVTAGLEDDLAFWLAHGVDHERGGLWTHLDRDGAVRDTDKGVWQQGRFAWLLGRLGNALGDRDAWAEARAGTTAFLDAYGFDPADGRAWFHVTTDGRPLRKRRYAFGEAFAALAYGEHAAASGDAAAADRARACFERFLTHVPAPKYEATRPVKALGAPMIALHVAQELRRSIGLDDADARIDAALEELERDFVRRDLEAVLETVGPSGELLEHTDGRLLNPGHAIEAAWFVLREARERDDAQLVELGTEMLRYTWRRGWDAEHGGLLYFTDLHGGAVQEYWHDMKFWWPQAEAVLAALLAWSLTGDAAYHAMYREAFDYVHAAFRDSTHGEWYGYLDRTGRVTNDAKGNLWKGPFHMPRMEFVIARVLRGEPI